MTLSGSVEDHLAIESNICNIINIPFPDDKVVKYCYTCKGKIRKYEIKSPKDEFIPKIHSTPSAKLITNTFGINEVAENNYNSFTTISSNHNSIRDLHSINVEINHIPSISRQIDSSYRQKYTSYEMRPNEINRRRLRKSLKGFGCVVNFALTDTPVKKRTQIQACSISVMIVAIVVISFVLVNSTTPSFTHATNIVKKVVPIEHFNDSYSPVTLSTVLSEAIATENYPLSTGSIDVSTSIFMSKIFFNTVSNISKTSPENVGIYLDDNFRKGLISNDFVNRNVSESFCSCQNNEVCMLDEHNGTSICKEAVDIDDPTGCGGLCALETEACQVVDRASGVRICRLLTLGNACSAQEWRCHNNLCVPEEARCDGIVQCYDRSDEMHCECDLTKKFRCGHGLSCFPNVKLCDGVIDCWDGFDEVNCTAKCSGGQFTCTDGDCIAMSYFCDGLPDCADGSDEPRGCAGACRSHEMQCKNRRCVSRDLVCNGIDNCGDASDELHCH